MYICAERNLLAADHTKIYFIHIKFELVKNRKGRQGHFKTLAAASVINIF
jgi:hypothetical protein